MKVVWTPPAGTNPDGGVPITGYLVEWWEEGAIDEIQLVRFTSPINPLDSTDKFLLWFGPSPAVVQSTANLMYNDDAFNLRSELLNLRVGADTYLIDELSVSRSPIGTIGYEWSITFHSERSPKNQGDQVMLAGMSNSPDTTTKLEILELTSGSRNQGAPEVQLIVIVSTGSTDLSKMGGWFRLSFDRSTAATQWLPVDVSAEVMTRALQQLNTVRTVLVNVSTSTDSSGSTSCTRAWTVSFTGNIGKQPAIDIETGYLFTSATTISATVYKGDNALSASYDKLTNAYPGETPKGYHFKDLSADTRSFVIPSLVPGNRYYVAVSAKNSFGIGPTAKPASKYLIPPKQIPQPPIGVSVDVHPGSSTSLDVTWDTPHSDGGSDILSYRVELDITPSFTNPIFNVVPCYPSSKHTVFKIVTAGLTGDPIISGGFKLDVSVNGNTFTTDFISHDAAASSIDEIGTWSVVPQIVATLNSLNNNIKFTASATAESLIFINDVLQFSSQTDPNAVYTVVDVVGNEITLDNATVAYSWTNIEIRRFLGGRGGATNTRVICHRAANPSICDQAREDRGGSVQSKLHLIPGIFSKGVGVDRDATPSATNGVTWRVTFLDDAVPAPYDYALSVTQGSNRLKTESGANATVTVTRVVIGEVYNDCTGTHKIPNDKALALGQYYYARVFALNAIGYSLPLVSPSKQKPMVVPGAPTAVTLSVFSVDGLTVSFNPPASDGGDTITQYKVEYATWSNFSNSKFELVTLAATGAKFAKTLTGLVTGTFYFVRVYAYNSQGFGLPTASTPGSLNPHRAPDAPTNVILRPTSNTMLTVSFAYPVNDGGDLVTRYRIEWDTVSNFNSILTAPHKGFVEVAASLTNSHTLTLLTENQQYFVRVYAINNAGLGQFRYADPVSAGPTLKVPGKPHTISAVTGDSSGSIAVSWLRPRVPWHSIPCSGFATAPLDCPTALGGSLAMSHGGTSITEYVVSYNEQPDFNGFDYGETTTTTLSTVIRNLTPGRKYYIRVLARNAQGPGEYCAYTDANCLVVTTPVSAVAGG